MSSLFTFLGACHKLADIELLSYYYITITIIIIYTVAAIITIYCFYIGIITIIYKYILCYIIYYIYCTILIYCNNTITIISSVLLPSSCHCTVSTYFIVFYLVLLFFILSTSIFKIVFYFIIWQRQHEPSDWLMGSHARPVLTSGPISIVIALL